MSRFLRLGVSALLFTWIAYRTDWGELGRCFAQLQVSFWLLGVGLMMVTQLVSTWRWRFFVRQLQFDRPFRQLAGYYFIGMYFNLMLPTSVGGDVFRAWYLDGGSGRKLAAFGSVFLERLNGVLVLIAIACIATVACPIDLPDWVGWTVATIAICAYGGLATLPLWSRWRGPGRDKLQKVIKAIQHLRNPSVLWVTTLLSVFVQAANVIIVWLIGLGLGLDVPGAFYWVMVPLLSLLMLAPLSVNGVGVREGGMVLMLAPLGVGKDPAVALALLWFANSAALSLMGGLVYMFSKSPRPTPLDDAKEEPSDGSVDRDSDQGRTRQLDQAA